MKNLRLAITVLLLVLIILASISAFIFSIKVDPSDPNGNATANLLYNIMIYVTYFLIGIAALSAVLFPIYFIISNPQKAKGTFISVGVLLAVFAISFLLSKPETGEFFVKNGISPLQARLIGSGIIATYIFLAGGLVMALYAEVSRWFK